MPSFSKKIESGHCIVDVLFINPSIEKAIASKALIDTGASSTTISRKIADELDLKSLGKRETETANGRVGLDIYKVKVSIPIASGLNKHGNIKGSLAETVLTASCFNTSSSIEALLGMDLLSQCVFTLSHGRFTLAL